MKVDVCYDLEDVWQPRMSLKRGERLDLEVWFHGSDPNRIIDPGVSIKFGAKEAGQYLDTALPMVYCDRFVKQEDGCFLGELQLNAENLLELIGNERCVSLEAEFEFNAGVKTFKTKSIKLIVYNDILKGTEGVPLPAPEFVTKDQLANEVAAQVDEVFAGKVEYLESLEEAAEVSAGSASSSQSAAKISETNAGASEEMAGKWAVNPKDTPVTGSGVGAKYSALHWSAYAQQYARNASDSADLASAKAEDAEIFAETAYSQALTSAAGASTSTEQARIAAELVASVADVGAQVTAAQSAASSASAKATEAAGSATAANSSKIAAATSATNAKTSETNAASSATSAAASKTACENILSQVQGLLNKVVTTDNIGSYAVTSFGGAKGAIITGTNLSMAGNTVNASGGGSLPANVITADNIASYAVTSFNGSKGTVTYNYTLPSNVLTTSNIASYAVTSFGGAKGAIITGTNLSMAGNTLNATGGGGGGGVSSVNGLTGALELWMGTMQHPDDPDVMALYVSARDSYGNEGTASMGYMMGLKGAEDGPYTQCMDLSNGSGGALDLGSYQGPINLRDENGNQVLWIDYGDIVLGGSGNKVSLIGPSGTRLDVTNGINMSTNGGIMLNGTKIHN